MQGPPLPHRIYSWYSFLLEAESTLEPSVAGRNKSNKNSNNTIGNWNRNLLACSCRLPQLYLCHSQNDSRCSSIFCCLLLPLLSSAVFCCLLLCSAVLCCVLLSSAVFCCPLLSSAVFCCLLLCSSVLCCVLLCSAVFCGLLLSSAVFCCLMLSSAVLCFFLLCSAVFCCSSVSWHPSILDHPQRTLATLFWSSCFSSSIWFPPETFPLRPCYQTSYLMASQFWSS